MSCLSSQALRSCIDNLRAKGSPLPDSIRQELEWTFQQDLSNVRIHAHEAANLLVDLLGCWAFAQGSDIFFGEGEFDSKSPAGRRLIAHEVAHTLQQGQNRRSTSNRFASQSEPISWSRPGDYLEMEAEIAADCFVGGPKVQDRRHWQLP